MSSLPETSRVQLTISLTLAIALVTGAYYAGVTAGHWRGQAEALEIRESRMAEIEKNLVELSTLVKQIAESQKSQGTAIAALNDRTGTLVTDVQVIQARTAKR